MAIVEEIPSTPTPTSTARQRKPKPKSKSASKTKTKPTVEDEIPLKLPSDLLSSSPSKSSSGKPLIDMDLPENSNLFTIIPGEVISEDHLKRQVAGDEVEEEEEDDEIFRTLIVAVPFTFLYLLLDILVHLQYNHRPPIEGLVKGVVTALPTLYMIVLYTNRYSKHWLTNPFLLSSSILSGCRLIWLVNKSSWSVVTSQAPPMGTLWILTIVQLPLSRAVLALVTVGGWIWYRGLTLMP